MPAPLAPELWQFWMESSDDHTEDGLYGFTLKVAETQIATTGYYLFTGSMKLRDARVGVAASWPGRARQCRLSTTSDGTTAVMSKAHHLFSSASYDPDTLNMLREVLDEIWASILNGFGNDFREVEAARINLQRSSSTSRETVSSGSSKSLERLPDSCERGTRTPSNAAEPTLPATFSQRKSCASAEVTDEYRHTQEQEDDPNPKPNDPPILHIPAPSPEPAPKAPTAKPHRRVRAI